jgi:hypothetical protein
MNVDVKLTAVYLKVPEGYIGFVEETKANLEEAIQLVLEANRTLTEESLEGQEIIREPISISAA